MRSALRFSVPICLAVLWAATILVWLRSYWRVDKIWVQVLPKAALEARLTPGQVTLGSMRSTVRLPIGDSHWFSWPLDAYFADFIPPPSNTLFCEFRIYNGTVTIPFWFLALLSALPSVAVFVVPRVRVAIAARLAGVPVVPAPLAPGITTGSLLRPNHPLIAVGPATPDAQAASAMQVIS